MNAITAWCAVRIYRMVPAVIRGHYPGFTISTSHRFRYGDTWATVRQLIGDSKPPRPTLP